MSDLVKFLSLALAFIAVSILIVGIVSARGCFSRISEADLAKEVKAASPEFHVSAPSLVNEYLADEAATAAKYNGKVGIVTGNKTDRYSDFRPLQYSRRSEWVNLYASQAWSVRCFWADDKDARSGSHLTSPHYILKGKVAGMNARRLTIDIRGCMVQESP